MFETATARGSMDEQETVAAFVHQHELEAPPAYRLLDLVAEVGEIATDAAESTGYGSDPAQLTISSDEVGDALFSLLALAAAAEIDAGDALEDAMAKYERRLTDAGTAGSGG